MQIYIDELVEKAIKELNLANAVFVIIQKLPGFQTGPWNVIRNEECRKYVHASVNYKIKQLLSGNNNESNAEYRLESLQVFIQVLINKSFFNIEEITSTFNTAIEPKRGRDNFAAKLLLKFIYMLKGNISLAKMKKIPEETRRKVVVITRLGKIGGKLMTITEVIKFVGLEGSIEEIMRRNDKSSSETRSVDLEFSQDESRYENLFFNIIEASKFI